ncbi:hypothetical protein LTR37_006572 [Vermiconidia calcicola]|uniref:Uncharacterized protein n=1 Tax=Vermiconidia calcicola TaxID=1690605 RepID=A0ACC3NGC2_9PEZI|nr:hypothetical protein LTR37_006572 [Vermiconidia calcicola]
MDHITDDAASDMISVAARTSYDAESLWDGSSVLGVSSQHDGVAHNYAVESSAAAQSAKAIEVATERSRTPDFAISHSRRSSIDSGSRTVILDAGPAPPDYAAAIAWRALPAEAPIVQVDPAEVQEAAEQYIDQSRGDQRTDEDQHPDHGDLETQDTRAQDSNVGKPNSLAKKMQLFCNTTVRIIHRTVAKLDRPVERVMQPIGSVTQPLGIVVMSIGRGVRPIGKAMRPGDGAVQLLEQVMHSIGTAMRPIEDVMTALSQRPAAERSKIFVRRHWLTLCLAHITFTFATLSLVMLLKRPRHRRVDPFFPSSSGYYSAHPRSRSPSFFHHQRESGCELDQYSDFTYTRVGNARNFTFREAVDIIQIPGLGNGSLRGRIDVRPAPIAQKVPIEVWVSVATTWPWKPAVPEITNVGDGIHLQAPRISRSEVTGRWRKELRWLTRCLDVWVGIYVAIELEGFDISTQNLNIEHAQVDEYKSWALSVKGKTHLSTENGSIVSDSFLDSRETTVESAGGPIIGKFQLRERLEVNSSRGLLDLLVKQQPRLKRSYVSGRAVTKRSAEHLERVTPAVLRTQSGGSNIFGTGTFLRFERLENRELPGSWTIEDATHEWEKLQAEKDHIYYPEELRGAESQPDNLYLLNALHISHSGDMSLAYGTEWEGQVEGTTNKGSIDLGDARWRLLPVAEVTGAPRGQRVNASRGLSESQIRFEASRGDVCFPIY